MRFRAYGGHLYAVRIVFDIRVSLYGVYKRICQVLKSLRFCAYGTKYTCLRLCVWCVCVRRCQVLKHAFPCIWRTFVCCAHLCLIYA